MKVLSLLLPFVAYVAVADEIDCVGAFIENYDYCMEQMNKKPATLPAVVSEDVVEVDAFVDAVDEESSELSVRSADLSGCGIYRKCTECANVPGNKCYWNPGTGCVQNNFMQQSVCTIFNDVAPKCEEFRDCYGCTTQNGCIFFRGQCTYSRGVGCEMDKANCINYSWNCPATPPKPPVVPVYPDRVKDVVTRVETMVVSFTPAEISRLRFEMDAMLLRKEQEASSPYNNYGGIFAKPTVETPIYTPVYTPTPSYSTYPTASTPAFSYSEPAFSSPAVSSYEWAYSPSSYSASYPASLATPTYEINSGYVTSFSNDQTAKPTLSNNQWVNWSG